MRGPNRFPLCPRIANSIIATTQTSTLILDLLETITIDASGLGLLVSLRSWAKQTGSTFKLMNVTPRVERLLQLTKLKSEFEICSAREMLDLLCRAMHQSVPAITVFGDPDVSVSIPPPASTAAA